MFKIKFTDGTIKKYDGCEINQFKLRILTSADEEKIYYVDIESINGENYTENTIKELFNDENLNGAQLFYENNNFIILQNKTLDKIEFNKRINDNWWDSYTVHIKDKVTQ
jgi:hypothetical protein